MGRCTSFHDDEAQREGCFRGEGLSSPAAVHCRPMVETDLGGGTCGTSYLMAATRSAWTFAVDTPKRLSRSAIISWSACPSPISDQISTGSPRLQAGGDPSPRGHALRPCGSATA